jgi:hypothetical protein
MKGTPMGFISRYLALLKLGTIHPDLMRLAWKLKRSKKTYLCYIKLLSLVESFLEERRRSPGRYVQVAEFGVGRGGSAAVLAWLVNRYGGRLTLYDIFGQIPAPTERDGERAQERYQTILNAESDNYYGNIPNLLDVIRQDLSQVCSLDQVEFIQGRYEETLPQHRQPRAYGLVHVDCDWYDSSMAVFNFLKDNIQPGAFIQVDDYSNWEGSNKAVNDSHWLDSYSKTMVEGALLIDTGKKA